MRYAPNRFYLQGGIKASYTFIFTSMISRTVCLLTLILYAYGCTSNNYPNARGTTAVIRSNPPVSPDASIVVPADYTYPSDSTFTLLSWNVEHFLDPYDDPYIDAERENTPPDNMPQRRHLLMEALRKADADIVVLQEFESAKYLRQLAADSLPQMQYRFFADVPSHGWYMNVVVMSRFPMGIISGYGSATTPLPNYVAEDGSTETQNNINTRMWSIDVFPAEDYAFLLTGVHLKAGRGPRNEAMRTGQLNLLAATFNRRLDENPGQNMIVAGDLNATPSSAEMGLLLRNDRLKNGFIDAVDTTVYSHPADTPTRRLDYLLVNRNMHTEVVENSIEIASLFPKDTMRTISDHLPVVGRFYKQDIENVNTSIRRNDSTGG